MAMLLLLLLLLYVMRVLASSIRSIAAAGHAYIRDLLVLATGCNNTVQFVWSFLLFVSALHVGRDVKI